MNNPYEAPSVEVEIPENFIRVKSFKRTLLRSFVMSMAIEFGAIGVIFFLVGDSFKTGQVLLLEEVWYVVASSVMVVSLVLSVWPDNRITGRRLYLMCFSVCLGMFIGQTIYSCMFLRAYVIDGYAGMVLSGSLTMFVLAFFLWLPALFIQFLVNLYIDLRALKEVKG